MKKTIACICVLLGVLGARASVVTNHVYVISNIYNQVFTEIVITQKVKSTHTNYYYTNYVSVVTNVFQTVYRTNTTVNVDVGRQYLLAASNEANRAWGVVSNASALVDRAASEATAAGASASAASASASRAAASASEASSAASDGLQRINERINWFDLHSGETITQVNSNITINVNAQDYSFTYTNASGQAFNYVTVHPYGANGGATVAPRWSGAYNFISIIAWPRPRLRTSDYWVFNPAYIDFDDKGMRLQYLPDTTVPIRYSDGADSYPEGLIVPEYFYWQSGYIYFKVRVWQGGEVVAWCLTRYNFGDWPSTTGLTFTGDTAMSLVDRRAYGSTSMGTTLAYFRGNTWTASRDTPIEFPMQPSPSYDAALAWMREGPRAEDDRIAEIVAAISDLTNRVAVLESAPVEPVEPPVPTPVAYVYNVKRTGSTAAGGITVETGPTFTVNVKNPTLSSTQTTDTIYYDYEVSKTWSWPLPVPTTRKGFPKEGYSFDPWTWLRFGSNDYQIQSRDTGPDEHSFFTGSASVDYGDYTYTFTFDHIDYE